MENECEALPGVAYPGVRDNRSTLNTKTGYDNDDDDDQHIIGHFRDESFQSITCTGTENLTTTTKRENTQITQDNTMQKGALVNSTTDTLKKSRLRQERQSLV